MPKAWIQNGVWGLLILAVTVGGHLMFAERQPVYGHDPRVATSTSEAATAPGSATSTLAATSTAAGDGGNLHTRHRQEEARGAAGLFEAGVFGIPGVSGVCVADAASDADSVPSASLPHADAYSHADANQDPDADEYADADADGDTDRDTNRDGFSLPNALSAVPMPVAY